MQTVYDWVTVAIFAGIIVIFLQRSFDDKGTQDSIWSYLPPSVGCALANYLGNEAIKGNGDWLHAVAVLTIGAVLAYIYFVIKPDWVMR